MLESDYFPEKEGVNGSFSDEIEKFLKPDSRPPDFETD